MSFSLILNSLALANHTFIMAATSQVFLYAQPVTRPPDVPTACEQNDFSLAVNDLAQPENTTQIRQSASTLDLFLYPSLKV